MGLSREVEQDSSNEERNGRVKTSRPDLKSAKLPANTVEAQPGDYYMICDKSGLEQHGVRLLRRHNKQGEAT